MNIPRMPGLQPAPVPDQDTLVVKKKAGFTTERVYGHDRRVPKYFTKSYELIGAIFDSSKQKSLVAQAKKYYAAHGLVVRVVKHTARSYGSYWDVYVGNGKWREGRGY